MPTSQNFSDSDLERRWRTWQEKSNRADRLADKRMKILFSVVAVILLTWILYYLLRADSKQVQRTVLERFVSYGTLCWLLLD